MTRMRVVIIARPPPIFGSDWGGGRCQCVDLFDSDDDDELVVKPLKSEENNAEDHPRPRNDVGGNTRSVILILTCPCLRGKRVAGP